MSIKNALKELLDNLDEVDEKYPGIIHDTIVREELHLTMLGWFVKSPPCGKYPSETEYFMVSDEANNAVHQALVKFLTHSEVTAVCEELTTPEERLDAFQDGDVESSKGNTYDWYFGWSPGLPPR